MNRPRRPSGRALASLGLICAVVYLAALEADLPRLGLIAKPMPALLLALWVAGRNGDRLGRCLASGLVLSAAGDVLLELGTFLPGLLAFLCAHLAYTAGFVVAAPRLAPARALPFLAFGVSVFLVLRPGLGAMAVPVGIYVAVICTMMWRAAARVELHSSPLLPEWLGLAGALAFAASDTLIAFDRFHARIPGAGLPIMLLYWLGQWGIAASCARPYGMLREQVRTP